MERFYLFVRGIKRARAIRSRPLRLPDYSVSLRLYASLVKKDVIDCYDSPEVAPVATVVEVAGADEGDAATGVIDFNDATGEVLRHSGSGQHHHRHYDDHRQGQLDAFHIRYLLMC